MSYQYKMKGRDLEVNSRERVKRALNFQEVDRVPIEVDFKGRFISDVSGLEYKYGNGSSSGIYGVKGFRQDEWGCVWQSAEDGVAGEVKQSLLNDWSKLDSFKVPWDVLEQADLSSVNKQCAQSDKFMVHMWGLAPFQRMQYLRGTENLFMDLAYGESEVIKLRDMIHEYYIKELTLWVNTDVDGIHIEDDWGSQQSLLISPRMWREYFKPLYKDYCDLAHSKGKYVIMHSDGYIADIIPDLIEIGVNAVNAQLDCMDVEKLAELYHGKITFWGGFDRQHLLPFGTAEEVRKEVRRIGKAFFKNGRTGVIGQAFSDKGAKEENIFAVYDEWLRL